MIGNPNALIGQYASVRYNDQGRPSQVVNRRPPPAPARQARRPKASIPDWRQDRRVVEVRARMAAAKSKAEELQKVFDDTKLELARAEERLAETKGMARLGLLGDAEVQAAVANLDRVTAGHEVAQARLAEHDRETKTDAAIVAQVEDLARQKSHKALQEAYQRAVKRLAECLQSAVDADEEVGLIHDAAAEMFPSGVNGVTVRIPSSAGLMFARWPRHMLTSDALDSWTKQRREEGILA